MARAVKEGRRGEFAAFGWKPEDIPDPEKVETFQRSKLRWDEVHEGRHEEMLEWYRMLIALRRGSPALNDGEPGQTKVSFDEARRWLVMERGAVTVMGNLGTETVGLDNPRGLTLVLASRVDVEAAGDKVVLPPDTLAVLSAERDGSGGKSGQSV
jgi:maltooligosyltrehalose trehalohydrolase